MKHKRTSARCTGRRILRAARRSPRPKRTDFAVTPGNYPAPYVSVIIPAMNEAGTIAGVIAEARKVHPRCEVIVVVNGSTDTTAAIAAKHGAKVLLFLQPLGHDVGRSVGAEAASGDILLFTDGDLPVTAAQLRPFVAAVGGGADVALNDYSGPVSGVLPHPVVLSKHALNLFLGRPDLKGSSLTAVPHALSRSALRVLGTEALSRPPLAHARAVMEGLQVQTVHHVPVGKLNAARRKRAGVDPLQEVVVRDHLDALALVLQRRGPRAGFSDGARRREMVR